MSRVTFNRGARMFPIRYQQELDLAVFEFRQVEERNRYHRRAQAWLAYAIMTALSDGWRHDEPAFWGEMGGWRDRKLGRHAQQIAVELAALLPDPANGPGVPPQPIEFEYDIRWALAYVFLHRFRFAKAKAQVDAAVELLDADGNPPDPGLLADAADFYVYLGVQGSETTPRSYRGAIASAFKEAARRKIEAPEWFYWVRGWTLFADAALAKAATNPKGESDALAAALADLQLVVPNPARLRQPHDFDACAVLAAVQWRMGDRAAARQAWEALVDQVWELRQRTWTVADEMKRSPFRVKRPTAGTIHAYWREALEAVQQALDEEDLPED